MTKPLPYRFTPSQKKILATVRSCGQDNLTADVLALKAGIKIEKLYEVLADPEFREIFNGVVRTSVLAETPAILHKFIEEGKQGSFPHGKLVLELAGIHQDKQKLELEGNVEFTETPFKSDDEKRAFVEATLSKITPKEEE